MNDYSKPIGNEEWSKHYNIAHLNGVVESVQTGNVQIWAKELCKIITPGESCLEIGCGTGISSLYLAKNGRKATAMDYTSASVELVSTAASKLNIDLKTVLADATEDLPFNDKEFDVIFQSGLLEHFSSEEQVTLLKNWKRYSKRMISMIPNAASVPYRIGKELLEKGGKWEYGLETPRHTLIQEFFQAGIRIEKEYTIGTEWALSFLPEKHFLKKQFNKLQKQGFNLDDMMQGYLLVTIGICE